MSYLFMLSCQKHLFSTYINDKTLVITTPNKDKLEGFYKTVINYKNKNKRWMNNAIHYSKLEGTKDVLDMTERISKEEKAEEYAFVPTYIDVNDKNDVRFIHQLYELANIEFFLMYDYDFIEEIPLLSIHGVKIEKPNTDMLFDSTDYLNGMLSLENE